MHVSLALGWVRGEIDGALSAFIDSWRISLEWAGCININIFFP
jgi:hypothetical protein